MKSILYKNHKLVVLVNDHFEFKVEDIHKI